MIEIRRQHPSLPGIAISGYGMEEDLARSRAAGFEEHLTKPISIDSLERALGRLLVR
jgi:CheY-like chemotaxis protein